MKFLCFALALISLPAFAQLAPKPGTPDAEPRAYISAKDLADVVAGVDAAAEAGTPTGMKTLLLNGPFWAKLEYHKEIPKGRAVEFRANINDAELLVVLEGSGTVVFGGKLVNPVPSGPDGFVSKSVEGGTAYKLAKGDMIMIPQNSPHAITEVDGRLVMMSMHLPNPAQTNIAAPSAASVPASGR